MKKSVFATLAVLCLSPRQALASPAIERIVCHRISGADPACRVIDSVADFHAQIIAIAVMLLLAVVVVYFTPSFLDPENYDEPRSDAATDPRPNDRLGGRGDGSSAE